MKNKRSHSILFKTQIYITIFGILLLLIILLSELFITNIYYKWYQIKTVNNVAESIKKDNDINIEDLAYENGVCITVFNDYGEVKEYNTRHIGCSFKNPEVIKYIFSFINGKDIAFNKEINNQQKANGYLKALKINNTDIFIYAPTQDYTSPFIHVKNNMVYIVIIYLIISMAVSSYISHTKLALRWYYTAVLCVSMLLPIRYKKEDRTMFNRKQFISVKASHGGMT